MVLCCWASTCRTRGAEWALTVVDIVYSFMHVAKAEFTYRQYMSLTTTLFVCAVGDCFALMCSLPTASQAVWRLAKVCCAAQAGETHTTALCQYKLTSIRLYMRVVQCLLCTQQSTAYTAFSVASCFDYCTITDANSVLYNRLLMLLLITAIAAMTMTDCWCEEPQLLVHTACWPNQRQCANLLCAHQAPYGPGHYKIKGTLLWCRWCIICYKLLSEACCSHAARFAVDTYLIYTLLPLAQSSIFAHATALVVSLVASLTMEY
jgi:hypothetical protein